MKYPPYLCTRRGDLVPGGTEEEVKVRRWDEVLPAIRAGGAAGERRPGEAGRGPDWPDSPVLQVVFR